LKKINIGRIRDAGFDQLRALLLEQGP
jgi:hypothetical protein